jgi:hypothetical protein
MGRLPKDKVTLSIYVSPNCKEKLECLQQLYFIAGKRFSLSQIAEETINMIYNVAFLCMDNKFWKGFFRVTKVLESSDATNHGIDEVLTIIQGKKAAAKEILKIPVSFNDQAVKAFKKKFGKD